MSISLSLECAMFAASRIKKKPLFLVSLVLGTFAILIIFARWLKRTTAWEKLNWEGGGWKWKMTLDAEFQKLRGGLPLGRAKFLEEGQYISLHTYYCSILSTFLTKKFYKLLFVGLFLNFALPPCWANLTFIPLWAWFSGAPWWQFSDLFEHWFNNWFPLMTQQQILNML